MSLVVLAYQEIGHVCLETLLAARAPIRLVLTHEDDPREEVWFRSVADLARRAGIPVWTPTDPNTTETLEMVRAVEPDFIFSFYYRHLVSTAFLGLARRGAYNMHGSLLPKYRGRVPVNWALINGETETGVTLHRMVAKPDAGPIVGQEAVGISETDTAATLYARLVPAAARLLARVWPDLAAGRAREIIQDETQATTFGRRGPEDGRIDWTGSAHGIYNLVRAVTHPYPGAFTEHQGRRLLVWSAGYDSEAGGETPGRVLDLEPTGLAVATGRGRLLIATAQWAGGPEMTGAELAVELAAGSRLRV